MSKKRAKYRIDNRGICIKIEGQERAYTMNIYLHIFLFVSGKEISQDNPITQKGKRSNDRQENVA